MSFTFNPFTGNFDKVVRSTNQQTVATDTIDALTSKVIDTIPLVDFNSLIYDYVFEGNAQSRAFKNTVVLDDGSVFDQVYGRLGRLQLSYDVNINGASVEILVTNPNSFDINVSFTKTTLS